MAVGGAYDAPSRGAAALDEGEPHARERRRSKPRREDHAIRPASPPSRPSLRLARIASSNPTWAENKESSRCTNIILNYGNYLQNPPEIYLSVDGNNLESIKSIQKSVSLENMFFELE